ncbi:hypothetical protein BOTBODRAFT_43700 [Botryobasidium botryosum FD-172 SS1]|uniref:Lysine-specific metallo-endopeptidase domain-containing protein n=1 Tax=Botryobasidium botryosum (strain FD-172 SS1) TaxID=930990 RepID=A0A067MW49_BOTB1|nr:hypothetical protein BOTBODRAFT_43700 [Botryobasidium botryosum FD-172 SS1]
MKSVAAAVLLSALASPILAAPGLSLTVSAPSAIEDVDALKVTTTLTNTGTETLKLLNDPNSVLTPQWKTRTFDITGQSSGAVPSFKGVKVKWVPTQAAAAHDYTTLAPGQTLTLQHDLAGRFNFTSSGPGAYRFSPSNTFTTVSATGELSSIQAATTAPLPLTVTGKLAPTTLLAPEAPPLGKRATFRSCSASQQTSINTAVTSAQTYATNAYNYLAGISSGTTRYTTWFGPYDATRKSTVQTHFNNIRNSGISSYTYDCSCTDSGTYAYVYPDTFGVVYFCGAFWNAPNTGTDSRAGTINHEASHFTRNGGTQDYQYGQSGCRSLATSNPARAVMNADSHEYFAENNPSQS